MLNEYAASGMKMDDDGYCHICHRSDIRGVKHTYTKKHTEQVRHVLKKFDAKVQRAKDYIASGPSIVQYEATHSEEKFWCPFCTMEIVKHERQAECTIMFKAWAEHLCSLDHHKKVHNFFWTNKLDMKKRDKYKLDQETMETIEDLAARNLERHRGLAAKVIQLEATHIREVERRRRTTLQEASLHPDGGTEIGPTTHNALATAQLGKDGRIIDPGIDRISFDRREEYRFVSRGGFPPATDKNSSPASWLVGHVKQSEYWKAPHTIAMGNQNSTKQPSRVAESSLVGPTVSGPRRAITGPSSVTVTGHKNGPDMDRCSQLSGFATSSLIASRTSNPSQGFAGAGGSQIGAPTEQRAGPSGWSNTGTLVTGQPGRSTSTGDPLLQGRGTGKKSKVVSSGGLTVISRKGLKLGGNVHTGAMPPWMMEDSEEEAGDKVTIGPTEEDYKKHLDDERKRKLNPKRVGANFDHDAATSEEWLPSFGRVWNDGPRWRSRKQYRKEVNNKSKSSR